MTQQSTYHKGSKNYGTGYEMMTRIDALEASIKSLVEALECIDNDLESRNFLENSSLRDTTRAALAAAKETPHD